MITHTHAFATLVLMEIIGPENARLRVTAAAPMHPASLLRKAVAAVPTPERGLRVPVREVTQRFPTTASPHTNNVMTR